MPDYSLLCFDSLCESFVRPIGALRTGQEVVFRLRLSKRAGAVSPRLLLYANEEWNTPAAIIPMTFFKDEPGQTWYQARFTPHLAQLLFYRFDAFRGENRVCIGKDPTEGVGLLGCQAGHWQLTVYHEDMRSNNDLTGGLIYQIFPDRFRASGQKKIGVPKDRRFHAAWGGMPEWRPGSDGAYRCDDYFGGDLQGIIEKLDYLRSLGVTMLYLNPIFEAHSNHRYNTADYTRVDPLLGSNQDFILLCQKAEALGMKVILDGVFSHTGSDSHYFNLEGRYSGGAAHDSTSPYRRWYQFAEDGSYKSWWGFKSLPEVNENDASFLDFIAGENGVLSQWMDMGASGWRLDVADEIPDEALDAICAAIRRKSPTAPIIGEVWEDASNKFSYGVRRRYLLGEQLNSVMNYPLCDAILAFVRSGDNYSLYRTLCVQRENYPATVLHNLMNSLSTHDIPRAITALVGESPAGSSRDWQAAHNALTPQEYQKGVQLFKLASALQYTLPGVPCLYYGDEVGLYGYRDPFNRACYPWGEEDQELLAWFRRLGEIRASCPVLTDGAVSLVTMSDSLFAYTRKKGNDALFVAVNRGTRTIASLALPPTLNPHKAQIILGDSLQTLKPMEVVMATYHHL